MWTDEHYGQNPKYTVSGLTLNILAWRFSYGAEYEIDPKFMALDLQPMSVTFTQGAAEKQAKLYVVPTSESPDHYYLTEWSTDPTLAETENPPTARWTDKIACVPCLEIVIPTSGGGNAIIVTPNICELPDPPDLRRDVTHNNLHVKAWPVGEQPEGWELLDAKKHKKAFPVSLGQLKRGENWYILTPEAEEKIRNS